MNIVTACVVAGMLTSNVPICESNEVLRVDVLDRCWCEVDHTLGSDDINRNFTPVNPNNPNPNDPPNNGNGKVKGNRGVGNYGEGDDPSPDYESNNPAGHTEPPGNSSDSSPGQSGDAPGQNK